MRVRLPLIFILLVASAVLLSVLLVPVFLAERNGDSGISSQKPQAAWISIDFGNGTRRAFEGPMENESYPLPAVLQEIIEDADLPIRLKGESIVSDDAAHEAGRWRVYRNGTPVAQPITNLAVGPGDRYELKYENKESP